MKENSKGEAYKAIFKILEAAKEVPQVFAIGLGCFAESLTAANQGIARIGAGKKGGNR